MFILLRSSLLFVIAALFLCCQKIDTRPDKKASTLALEEKDMESPKNPLWQEGAELFYILKDQSVVPVQKIPPEGFYVRGKIEKGKFISTSGVLGIGALGKAGRYGWLELNTKNFYPMESDQRAETPFVKGYMNQAGFHPADREVIDSP